MNLNININPGFNIRLTLAPRKGTQGTPETHHLKLIHFFGAHHGADLLLPISSSQQTLVV